ncbi:MAG: glycine zipper domain-containing protein [Bacteroidota bacterium]|nr:glycine zipper domain-containing protein [Bacteroidota bacterium]
MKKILFALSTVAIMASCTSNTPKTASETKVITPADTSGLAQFQAWKAQNELVTTNPQTQQNLVATQPVKEVVKERVVYVNKPTARKSSTTTHHSTSTSNGSSSNSSVGNSTSQNTARKKGWSKAAKGAVIGGAGGAVIGAVINKRNRGVGAVIGGVLGAGAGYGIGRSKDKKDGRY